MAEKEPVDLSQPDNSMTSVSDRIRNQLLAKNSFASEKNEYGVTNKDAMSDGDDLGRGTGTFLDIKNGGTSEDIVERNSELKINTYSADKPYTTPTS